VVEVHDRNKRPLAGALVTFTLPNYGASGTFADGSQVLSVTTDAAAELPPFFAPMALPDNSRSISGLLPGTHRGDEHQQTNTAAGAAAGSSAAAATAAGHSTC